MCPVNDNFSSPDARSQILMTRSPAPVANHWLPGSTATLLTQPKCPEITRISFHGGWYVGLTVRVVLWSCKAFVRLFEDENVEGVYVGVLSILAMIRPVSVAAGKSVPCSQSQCIEKEQVRRTTSRDHLPLLFWPGRTNLSLLCQ